MLSTCTSSVSGFRYLLVEWIDSRCEVLSGGFLAAFFPLLYMQLSFDGARKIPSRIACGLPRDTGDQDVVTWIVFR